VLSFPQKRKTLVIFSDMVEESGELNFERDRLEPARVQGILATLSRDDRLPNLSGVSVYVVGATHVNLQRYRRTREFWLALFKAAGADLRPENYGSTSAHSRAPG
jgi:hypothetical protein